MRIRQKSIRINKLEYKYVKFNFMRAFKVGIEPTFFYTFFTKLVDFVLDS